MNNFDIYDRIDNEPRPLERAINKKRQAAALVARIEAERAQFVRGIAEATMQERGAPTLEQADYWNRQRRNIEERLTFSNAELHKARYELDKYTQRVLDLTADVEF